MAMKRVQSDALNLRREPKVQEGNILAVLVKGQAVTVVGPSSTEGWAEVKAMVNSVSHQGFVADRLLRDPVSEAKERLITAGCLRAECVHGQRRRRVATTTDRQVPRVSDAYSGEDD